MNYIFIKKEERCDLWRECAQAHKDYDELKVSKHDFLVECEELFFLEELYKLHMSTWTRPMKHLLDLEGFSQVLNDLLIDS